MTNGGCRLGVRERCGSSQKVGRNPGFESWQLSAFKFSHHSVEGWGLQGVSVLKSVARNPWFD